MKNVKKVISILALVGLMACGLPEESLQTKSKHATKVCTNNGDCLLGYECKIPAGLFTGVCKLKAPVNPVLTNTSCGGKRFAYGKVGLDLNDFFHSSSRWVHPALSEHNNLAAVKLTPSANQYPFTVKMVKYALGKGSLQNQRTGEIFNCNPYFAHEVLIWKGPSFSIINNGPVASPVIHERIVVPARAPLEQSVVDTPYRIFEKNLQHALTIQEGESVYIAIRVKSYKDEGKENSTTNTCIVSCAQSGGDFLDFWGASTSAPYDWRTLASYQFPDGYLIEAHSGTSNLSWKPSSKINSLYPPVF